MVQTVLYMKGAAIVTDRRGPEDESFEIYSDNEVILTWRPAKSAAEQRQEPDREAA